VSEDPDRERLEQLLVELDALPYEEREAAIAALSEDDREAVWAAELEASDEALPDDVEELGGGD
jgi:hypothetical protein